jgi:outer membrane protein assembly factor BamB
LADGSFVVSTDKPNGAFATSLSRVGTHGASVWDRVIDGMRIQVAGDGAGSLYGVGVLSEAASWDGKAITATTYPARVLCKLDEKGALLWSKPFTAGSGGGFNDAIIANGDGVVVVSTANGPLSIDGQTYGQSQFQSFVLRASPDGKVTAVRSFSTNITSTTGLALLAGGDLFLVGTFNGVIDFGDGPRAAGGSGAIFLARLAPDGQPRWAKHYAGSGVFHAVPHHDAVVLSGTSGGADLGIGRGLRGRIVTRIGGNGTVEWAKQLGGYAGGAFRVAVSPSGHIVALHEHGAETAHSWGGPTKEPRQRELLAIDTNGDAVAAFPLPALAAGGYMLGVQSAASASTVIVAISDQFVEYYGYERLTAVRRLRVVPGK